MIALWSSSKVKELISKACFVGSLMFLFFIVTLDFRTNRGIENGLVFLFIGSTEGA